jgi:hypothetical protein
MYSLSALLHIYDRVIDLSMLSDHDLRRLHMQAPTHQDFSRD